MPKPTPSRKNGLSRPWLLLGIGLALLAGLGFQVFMQRPAPPAVASGEAQIGGPFELVDQHGQRRTAREFAGRYMLIYFGYSFCPDICPTDLAALGAGLAQIEASDAARGAKVQPIFITIDPQRDTVAALKDYVPSFHPRLLALTGSVTQINAIRKAYHVYAQKNIDAQDPKNYLVDHTALLYLMGPDGKYVAHLGGNPKPAAIAAWLKQKLS
jgi:protein SCO1